MPVTAVWRSFSGLGLLLGALFFAASLTPSLIPRGVLTQGALGGVCFAAGYGLGVVILWTWWALELPAASERVRRFAVWAVAALAVAIVAAALSMAAEWQNDIRALMGIEPVDSAHPMRLGLIAAAVAAPLILIGRTFQRVRRFVARRLDRVMPPRVSQILGLLAAATLFMLVVEGVLLRAYLRVYDSAQAALDGVIEPDQAPPEQAWRTGSAASLLRWRDLGREGRAFVANGPTARQIGDFLGAPAADPLRVYVGLNAAETPEGRARLALDELIRVGGFDRSVLVVAAPTGTGWVDGAAIDPLEYLHAGDVATVAVQYSYLESWVSLLVEPDYGVKAARALFRAVYRHWTALPPDARPRLYLYGLSLGALSSEQSLQLHEILGDPVQGAVWAGPPFPSPQWRSATEGREAGSPAWLPRFGDGSIIRFTAQRNALDIPGAAWGPMRIVYLQYASDPIVFFEQASFWRQPEWMAEPKGPDVSPRLRWYPVVTFLQLLLDMAISMDTPSGYGHVYAPAHYIDAWRAVTEPGWTPAEIDRLKAWIAGEGAPRR